MDCGQPDTDWGGPTYGILLCVKCAGRHRSLGTHLTVIKSVNMDCWDPTQVKRMELGGNKQLRDWFRKCQTENSALEMKYRTKAATLYREKLQVAAEAELNEVQGQGTSDPDHLAAMRARMLAAAAAAAAAAAVEEKTLEEETRKEARRARRREQEREDGGGTSRGPRTGLVEGWGGGDRGMAGP
ncbi:unnamed protein product, partial [Discosporangium mesarthrocarpum]